ncbi:phage/plasmid primase, P4 family [Collinsella stercoris]|uniref:phage/plasmid primase, P4 family n=1 Tax=Collinsella stercoris TaxID=147206 RepID=UPI003AF05D65
MTKEEQLSELGRAALAYVRAGFAVFPCRPRSKVPNTPHGLNDWTDNPEHVINHWGAHPNDNIGITCGAPSGGLLVLDFDVSEAKNGLETLKQWEMEHGELPETAEAITGSGGKHYFFRTDRNNIKPTSNQELGVDVRCDGSFVVAPGSIHPNGNAYEWWCSPWECEMATADGNVLDFLDYVQRNGGEDGTRKENGKFRLPDKIKSGERDKTLFRYASHLRSVGRSDEEIMATVLGVNFQRCEPPMDSRDIQRIVKSACKYERGGGVNDSDDGRKVGAPGKPGGGMLPRGPKGGIKTNELAKLVIKNNLAQIIDGAPAVWTGRRWEFGARAINRCTLELADDAKKQDKAEVVSYIMDKAPCVTSDNAFDGGYYVQFSNCTYDVLNDTVVEPTPSMFIIATLPVELNMDAPRNEADEFLESVADNDPDTLQAMKEVIGACMCSRRVLSQSPMLIGRAGGASGKASNGKSTFLNWLRSILGTENVSSLDIATLGQRFQAGRVVGKLANLGDDIPDGFLRGDELSMFKKLVTGDAIYTDVKNGEGFEFRPSASMVFSMNAVPRLQDTTDGVFRRLAFIPFRRRFSPGTDGYDPNIAAKLAKPEVMERGALLGLMALGELIRRGSLTPIPDMMAEVEEVKQDNDSVTRWIFEECITGDDVNATPTSTVFKRYADWCSDSGERNPCSLRTFSSRMTNIQALYADRNTLQQINVQIAIKQRRHNGKNCRTFVIESKTA